MGVHVPPILNPHPIPQGHPSAPALNTLSHASNLDWRSISHMIIYTFQWHSLKSSHPRLFRMSSTCYWRRKWQPIPVFLSGKSHGWRSLVGPSSWGSKESDMTEQLHYLLYHSVDCIELLFQDTRCLLCPLLGLGSEVQEYSFYYFALGTGLNQTLQENWSHPTHKPVPKLIFLEPVSEIV